MNIEFVTFHMSPHNTTEAFDSCIWLGLITSMQGLINMLVYKPFPNSLSTGLDMLTSSHA